MARGSEGVGTLSLWVAILGAGSLTLVTDSGLGLGAVSISTQKIWRYGHRDWLAAAGSFRSSLPIPPDVWPSPDDPGLTFAQCVQALDVQMRSGELTTSPVYALALIRASDDGLELARVTNAGTEFASVGTVFLGGFAEGLPAPEPSDIPNDPVRCRDIAVSMGARTLRLYGHKTTSQGAKAIAWPLFVLSWRQGGTMTAARIDQAEGVAIETEIAQPLPAQPGQVEALPDGQIARLELLQPFGPPPTCSRAPQTSVRMAESPTEAP